MCVYFVLSFRQRSADLIQKIAQLVRKGVAGKFMIIPLVPQCLDQVNLCASDSRGRESWYSFQFHLVSAGSTETIPEESDIPISTQNTLCFSPHQLSVNRSRRPSFLINFSPFI